MFDDKRLSQLWENAQHPPRYDAVGNVVLSFQAQLDEFQTKKLSRIKTIWPQIVGDDLADLSFPCRLRSDILVITVSAPAVKFELEQVYREAILEQIRDLTGKGLRDIKCVLESD